MKALACNQAVNTRMVNLLGVTALDLFIVAGQSNASGQGATVNSETPTAGTAFDLYHMTFRELADSVGNANIGSAWPTFCSDYYTGFSRVVCIMGCAVDGSAQYAGGSSDNWDTTGELYDLMVTKITKRIAYLNSLGITVTLRGILWCQGERDADQIDNAIMTQANYETALSNMITRIQSDFSTLMLYISQTGEKNTGDTTGFSEVRASQNTVATASAFADLAFTGAVDFPGEGKMQDTFHYTTAGYQEMGADMAAYVISDDPAGIVYSA